MHVVDDPNPNPNPNPNSNPNPNPKPNPNPNPSPNLEVGVHVVDDLREDARPVDAVHRGEAVVGAEGRVVEERLDVRLPAARATGEVGTRGARGRG